MKSNGCFLIQSYEKFASSSWLGKSECLQFGISKFHKLGLVDFVHII